MRKIIIKDKNEKTLIENLNKRNDTTAERIKRSLALPDLSKKRKFACKNFI